MASLLLRILFCLGKRPRDPTIPDDRSRLIPASVVDGETLTGDAPGPNARTAFDHVIFQERLGSIVRSKEGKMVNVTSPLPFNLHNKPRALLDIMTQGSYMSSSSRSASTSTFHESQSPNSDRHYTSRPPPLRMLSGLRITPLNSTPHSRSRSPSSAYSVASSSKDADSDEEEGLEKHVHERPAGILGLRLVRRHDIEYGSIGRRGRAKLKKDVDEDAIACDALDLDLPEVARGRADTRDKSGAGIIVSKTSPPHLNYIEPNAEQDRDRPSTSPKGSPLEVNEQGCSLPPQLTPQLSISPAPDTFEFRLLEVGALSVSWGE